MDRVTEPSFAGTSSPVSVTTICLAGEQDISTDGSLLRRLSEAVASSNGPVVVDMSDVTFIGASTLGVLVAAHNLLATKSRAFTLTSPSPCAQRVIDICNLDEIFGLDKARGIEVDVDLSIVLDLAR